MLKNDLADAKPVIFFDKKNTKLSKSIKYSLRSGI